MYNTALELHNDLLKNILMNTLLHLMPKEVKINPEYASSTLIFDENNYSEWYKEKSGDEDKLEKERDQKYQL